jgi:hypothetical protein
MSKMSYAKKWFELNSIPIRTYRLDPLKSGVVMCVEIGGFELELSSDEINYRAQLFLESELQGVKVN